MARIREWQDLDEMGDYASYLAAGWGNLGGANVVASPHYTDAGGNGGAYALTVQSNQFADRGITTPLLGTPTVTFYRKFHFRFDTFGFGTFSPFRWQKGSTVLGRIVVQAPSGQILFQRGNGAATLATSVNTMSPNTWYTVEVQVTIGASAAYEVRVDDSSVGWIPPAVGNTQPGSDTNVDNLFMGVVQGPGGVNVYFDDGIADDAVFPGEGVTTDQPPNGAGVTTQLTPSSGANWQNVDEIPPSDVDYNTATAANQEDLYAHATLPVAAGIVKSALVVARVARVGSGIQNSYIVMRSGVTNFETAAKPLGTSYAIVTGLWENDPAGGAWTPTTLNASEIGIRFDV